MAQAKARMSIPSSDILAAYRNKLANGSLTPDAAQAQAAVRLQHLASALGSSSPTPPKGVYLYGPVGRGKSMLMELFFQHISQLPTRRVHMHAFMDELHRRMHAMPHKAGSDLMTRMAQEIAAEASVLGFDEFYITNIADAMLLGRLFEKLFQCGVVVVATSNWPMEDLFQGGVNRDRFLPFIKQLQKFMEPVSVSEGTDYRLSKAEGWPLYIVTKPGESAEAHLTVLFNEYGNGPTALLQPDMPTPRHQKGRTVWYTFSSLCDQALGRTQYLNLARTVDTLILEGVPSFTASDANAALRFVTLIDIFYENRKRVIISAADYPGNLCPEGDAAMPFARTASRLAEMQSLV